VEAWRSAWGSTGGEDAGYAALEAGGRWRPWPAEGARRVAPWMKKEEDGKRWCERWEKKKETLINLQHIYREELYIRGTVDGIYSKIYIRVIANQMLKSSTFIYVIDVFFFF
jgi:hypothetical protein